MCRLSHSQFIGQDLMDGNVNQIELYLDHSVSTHDLNAQYPGFCREMFFETIFVQIFLSPIHWLTSDEQLFHHYSDSTNDLNVQDLVFCQYFRLFFSMMAFRCVVSVQSTPFLLKMF